MKLSGLKWWHWTLITVAVAALIRVATGGPLPFIGHLGAGPSRSAAAAAGRPERQAGVGPSIREAVTAPGMTLEQAMPELHRLTISAAIDNPGEGIGLVNQTGTLVHEVAQALQKGVKEDSTAISEVRVLVTTKGVDRTGAAQNHLPLYSLTFPAKALFAMPPDAGPADALAAASAVVFNGADAHKAMRDWCAKEDNLNKALAFCGKVTAAKGV